jgi:Domain of unknown function (DUF5753)
VAEEHRESLVALGRESRRSGHLEAVAANFPDEYAAFLYAEAEAVSVWTWDPQVIPGLLQTSEYARAMMLALYDVYPIPSAEVERRVEARMLRQEVLHRDPPFLLSAVIDESVIYRKLGDSSTMLGQLDRLSAVSELPNVTLQVMPLAGNQSVTTGAFIYMRFPQVHDVPLHDIAVIEHLIGSDYVEEEEDAFKYYQAFKTLNGQALSPADSASLIRKAMHEIWQ